MYKVNEFTSNMTYEFILTRMLESIPDDVDKREGSVIYDALAPAALELAQFYSALDSVIDETFADSAGREMLVRRAAERGITPYPATYAVVQGQFNVAVPNGVRFSIDDLRYRVIEGNRLICENIGVVGNRTVGDLIPVDYIEGLTSAKITGLVIPGEDDEDVEHLRKRYFDSLETQSYGGNISDYKRFALGISGVGGVKVQPAFNGGGTVKLIVQDYQWGVPPSELIARVKNTIDPAGESGNGEGLAPIGHQVTVVPVGGVVINISANFIMAAGHSFNDAKPALENIVGEYLREVAVGWANTSELVIRSSQLESRLLNQSGVVDIENLRLNNGVAGRNIKLAVDAVPLMGVVSNVV